MSSDDSGLSTGAEDGGKSEAASEEEDEAQSEGAESEGAESEGDNARRKEQVTKKSQQIRSHTLSVLVAPAQ